jgi:hypothetical protein
MKTSRLTIFAAALSLAALPALAANTAGSAGSPTTSSSAALGATTGPAKGRPGSAAAGSGGSAAVGGTSASTLGVGATSTGSGQTSSALGMGASGAATNGKVDTRTAVHGNRNLDGQAMARAQDGGTFSKSHTVCHDKAGSSVSCRTKTMAHEPGSKPVMSTNTSSSTAQ